MGKFQFYHINEHYISYLHNVDNRVQYNKGQRRPYIGIVLSLNGVDYYVPLESPKPNHANIKGGGPVMKLDEGRLGVMGFNNMIPVLESCLIRFDIQEVKDTKYKMLLLNQLEYCNKIVILFSSAQKQLTAKLLAVRFLCIRKYAVILKSWSVKAKNTIPTMFRPKRRFTQLYLLNKIFSGSAYFGRSLFCK